MPTSIDPQPADNEIECGRCGAHFYYELTRCPNCGVNLYEPDDDTDAVNTKQSHLPDASQGKLGARFADFVRRITRKPYAVDTLFGTAINLAELYDNLLVKAGGDRATAERLLEFEQRQAPDGNRIIWLENAIRRWEQDNRVQGK
jgi:hypothetical protein